MGISQIELANALGVSPSIVTRILSGNMPGRKHMPKIADLLNCTVEWLQNGTGTPPSWATAPAPSPAPPWAVELLAEVRALRAQLAALGAPVLETGRPADLPPAVAALQRQMRRAEPHAPAPAAPSPQPAGADR